MDVPMQMMGSQLAQEWDGLMQAVWQGLAVAAGVVILVVAVGSVLMESCRTLRPRRFWCRSTGRDVEVLFEEWGPPGFRHTLRVAQCSAFEPGTALACHRACRDRECRSLSAPFGLAEECLAHLR